jgi:DNA transposition AAA+ family ATPase
MITTELKNRILTVMAERRSNFTGSDAKFSTSLGISSSQYNRIKNGELERVLSDENWISIARKLEINLSNNREWKTARTPVFEFITTQLELCQKNGASLLFCDQADIGKTYTAKHFVKTHQNAVYVDCSQVKSRQKLIRFIAKEFGVGNTGKYADVYADLVFYLQSLPNPLVILDEAGDLDYTAFLELKAIWNATEHACGWYMMGADGLKEKIKRSIDFKKVGFTELFSRYGAMYQKVTPDSEIESNKFKKGNAALIAKVNADASMDVQKLVSKSDGSLRRLYQDINKQRSTTEAQ